MREIKFRGLDMNTQKWRFGNLVSKPQTFIVGQMIDWNEEYCNLEFWWPVIYASVSQFTGLKDKNGKDIYEGDILDAKKPCVVMWDDIVSGWRADSGDFRFEMLQGGVFEVIGNIYQSNSEAGEKKGDGK